MPRIFNYGDIPNIRFTPDKELNIFIYTLSSYLIIYRSHILLKMVRFFFWPTLYMLETYSLYAGSIIYCTMHNVCMHINWNLPILTGFISLCNIWEEGNAKMIKVIFIMTPRVVCISP